MQMHPCLLDDKSMTAWEGHGTEQTFKGVIESDRSNVRTQGKFISYSNKSIISLQHHIVG